VRLFRAVRDGAKHIAALRGRWQLKMREQGAGGLHVAGLDTTLREGLMQECLQRLMRLKIKASSLTSVSRDGTLRRVESTP
jgi:hypothetical protein